MDFIKVIIKLLKLSNKSFLFQPELIVLEARRVMELDATELIQCDQGI